MRTPEHKRSTPGPSKTATATTITWGSGYPYKSNSPQLFVTRLTNGTGNAFGGSYAIWDGHVEGAYVTHHNGYFYLFFNSGSCCSGTSSMYEIHVARSTSPTGPYVERSSLFLGSSGIFHGPGQIGILDLHGTYYYAFHYYPSGRSVLGIGTLTWGSDGWPTPDIALGHPSLLGPDARVCSARTSEFAR